MTKSIATASINRETAVALIDAAIAAARTIGIPAAVAVVDATGNLRAFERTAYRPRMGAVGGGYPILEDGKLIGGIGISGGNYQQDQDACVEALMKIGFQLPA